MRMKNLAGRAITIASTIVVGGLAVVSPAFADHNTFNPGVSVFDNFDAKKSILQPKENAYWWIDGQGTLPDGSAARVRGENNCDLQTCIQIVKKDDNDDSFVRIKGSPTTTTTNYTNANMAEVVDGADGDPVYGGQTYSGPWTPSFNHPVTVETRMRFGSNFNQDGTGGAQGTAGVWLWSNPFSQGNQNPFSIYDGMGFSWDSADSETLQGLVISVTKGAFPVFAQPVTTPINMQDWNTFKVVWSQDLGGNQNVKFYLNGDLQAEANLVAGVTTMQNMGLEAWMDNQAFKPSQYPNYIQRIPITQDKQFDIDYVSIQKQ
jgi:hypothetical protein